MWWDRSISAAVVRQLSCSSRQLVNSARIGNGNAPDRPLRIRFSGPPASRISSSRLGMSGPLVLPLPPRSFPCTLRSPPRLLLLSQVFALERGDPFRGGLEPAERVE